MIADPPRRRFGLPRVRVRARRPGPRTLVALLVVLAVLVGAGLWVRQSSLVAVHDVTVTGVAGPNAAQIRRALRTSAESMTTLDASASTLKAAVARYPVVRSLSISTHFPHGLTIAVAEEVPVATIAGTEVSASGTLLHSATATEPLPTIAGATIASGRVSGAAAHEVQLLADAPYTLLSKVASAATNKTLGLEVTLRNGPVVYFGTDSRLTAKWNAVTAVLADPTSAGADYIDVTDPARPAAGAGTDGATSSSQNTTTTEDSDTN